MARVALFLAILASQVLGSLVCRARGDSIPSTTTTGPVPVVTTSQAAFDGPKIGAVNSTAFDWWYFDGVSNASTAGQSTIEVIFYRTTQSMTLPVSSVDYVQVTITFANGTVFDNNFPANSSSVTTAGFGASGVWGNVGSFHGTPDLSTYTVTLTTGPVQGSLLLRSTAPAHYPDGNPPGSHASTFVGPLLGWVNPIPAAIATCKMVVQGQPFSFTGIGYHDHNWGGLLLSQTIVSWYWGHATVGDFSIVWFDLISAVTSTRYSSVYLVKDSNIVMANNNTAFASDSNFALVLPFGGNTDFPPPTTNLPTGFLITYVGDDGELWTFAAEGKVAFDNNPGGTSGYTRWMGTVTGGQVGGSTATGPGVWEWLRFYL
jgi:hypothetical protein